MSTLTRRTSPMADMIAWLESNSPVNVRGVGLTPFVRVEDFMEEGSYVLRAEIPGIDPEKDVEVTVEHDMLTIHGERREVTKDKNHQEFHYGSFSRTVALPSGADTSSITAGYEDGVLTVKVPVSKEAPTSVRIPIQRHE